MDKINVKTYNEDFDRHIRNMPPFEDRVSKYKVPVRFEFFNRFVKDNDRVLDCGCFDGELLYYLCKTKKIEGYGIDISDKAIESAKCNLKPLKNVISLQQAEIENIPFDNNSFDVVIASQVMEHVKKPIVMLKEMYRVTKENCFMIVSVPIMKNLLDKLHLHFFNFYDIMELFDKLGSNYKIYKYYKYHKRNKKDIFIVVTIKGSDIEPDDNEEVE